MNFSEKNKVDYDLLAKFFAGETNAAESAAVRSWRQESAENQMQFIELKFLWSDTKAMKNIGKETLPEVDVESALSKIKSRSAAEKSTPKPQLKVVKSPGRNFFLRIAAGLALLVGAGWFVFNSLKSEVKPVQVFASNEIKEQTLSDKSVVKLNKGSKLTYPTQFAANTREVQLEGEAFFEVEPNPKKPFLIRAGEANVEVLGTSFNVKSHSNVDSTLVFVESGKVLLYFEENKVTLTKGMTGVFYKKTKEVKVLEAVSPDHSFWRNRNLSFKRTELSEVVSKLNLLYGSKIRLQNEKLVGCNLTVDFENKTIDEILDIISLTLDLEVVRTASGIELQGEGC